MHSRITELSAHFPNYHILLLSRNYSEDLIGKEIQMG